MSLKLKPKRSMTSIDLLSWVRENKGFLEGALVSNIYKLSEAQVFIFKLIGRSGVFQVLAEPAVRIHLTGLKYPKQKHPEVTVQAFRKHLRGDRVEGVVQVGFDRILELSFKRGYKLYIELVPRGLMVLVDKKGRILHATEYREMRDRTIKRGLEYRLPPHFEKAPSYEECTSYVDKGPKDLLRELGIPKEVLSEALYRNKADPCSALKEILEESTCGKGYIVYEKDEPLWFGPFCPYSLSVQGLAVNEFNSFNEALEEYFGFYDRKRVSELEARRTETTAIKLRSSLERERAALESYAKEYRRLHERAMLMLSNKGVLESLLECVERVKETYGWNNISERCTGVVNVKPQEGIVQVKLGDVILELLVYKSVKEQIDEVFEEYKKYKKKYESGLLHLKELEERLKREMEAIDAIKGKAVAMLRKKAWYERFRWSFTRNGLLVLAGKNASQNEVLVRRFLEESDIFLHAEIHGAPATILKVKDGGLSQEDIKDAATIAACYSKAWKLGLASQDVFWVWGSQVSKSPPPGEYLPKGSFMIYGKKNYVKAVPLELVVGIEKLEEEAYRFIVGSMESVTQLGRPVAVLAPGDEPTEKIARKIIDRAVREGLHAAPLSLEELTSLIPGPSRIKKFLL
uniref:Fibronectin-binding domain-containing protein n=1 Tax=Fervidicoccus fontis TaxID=683846 RepID=A0A7J3ZJ34_9CREN